MAVKSALKWAGSKARIMPLLLPHLPTGARLVEPFAGSCSVMMNTDYDEYLIADVNPDLVNVYKQMAFNTDALLGRLEALYSACAVDESIEGRAAFYYSVRDNFNVSKCHKMEAAAEFIFLNRHGFNGLCRYNRAGHFNVPYGKYKAPYFPAAEIRAFAEKAKRATFITANYSETLDMVRDGDVVYCDPPYLTESGNFAAYTDRVFDHMDHGRLARRLRRIASLQVPVVASNSDLATVHSLYDGFELVRINAPRSVGAAAASQKVAAEVIIKSLTRRSDD